MADGPTHAPNVTDTRTAPRGVMPRGTQAWLMAGLALVILGIIVFTGRPAPSPRASAAASGPAPAPNPDRLREYQDRLRALDERARQQASAPPPPSAFGPARPSYPDVAPPREPAPDAIQQDRARREYESLFASNVVVSRRADAERMTTGNAATRSTRTGPAPIPPPTAPPSLDEVAAAVVRASGRMPQPAQMTSAPAPPIVAASAQTGAHPRPATGPISAAGPTHRVLEGTVIDTVLTNRLDGGMAAPVNCLVTNSIYSHDGGIVVIPAGSRVLGHTKPVQAFGESRLAVAFDRLILPDGRTYPLDQFTGLNQIGDAGLRDQVNQHYASTFGASAAIGLISGLGQLVGSAGINRGSGDRTLVIAGSTADTTTQAMAQTMNRFLNRLPTITIREGHRVKVYLTNDLELPAYAFLNPTDAPVGAR